MPEKFSKFLYDTLKSKNIKLGYNYAEFDSLLTTDKNFQDIVYESIGKDASGWSFEEFELAIEDKDYKENKVTKGNAESAIWRVLGNLFKSSFIGSAPVIPMHTTQYSKEITDDIEIIKEKSKEDVLQLWEDPIGGGASIGKGILRGGGKLALSMGNYALTAKDLSNLYSTENRLSSSIRGNSVLDNVFLEMGLRQNELDEFVDKTIPVQKGFENSFLFGKVPEGIGQAGVTILPGVAMFRAGFSPFYISSAIGIGTQTPIMVGDAVKGGAKTEDLKEVAAWAIPIGMVEALGGKQQADFFLKPFLREGNWYGFAKELGKAWVRSGKTESLEEIIQTVGENATAINYYDFERGLFEGTLEAGAAAFISSGTLGVGTKLVSGIGKDYKVSEMNDETKKKLNVINLAPSAELQIQKDGNYKIVDLKTEATPEFKEAKELAEKMLPEIKKNEAADEVIRDRKISEEASKSGQVEKVSPRGSNEVIEGNVEAVDIEKNLGVIENLIKGEKGTVLKTSRDSKTASLVQGTTIVIDKVELTAEEQAELKHKLELRQQKEITRKELDSWKSNFGKQVGIRLQEEINKKQASIEKKKIADAVNVEISEIEIHNFAHRLVGFKNDLANKLVKRENFIKDITDKFVGYNTIDEALAGFKIEKEIANQIKKNVELHPEFKKIQVKAEGKTVAEKIANTHIEFKSTAPQAYTMQIAAYIDSINEMETESLVDSYEDSVLFQEHKKHTEQSKAAFRQHNKDVRFYGRFSKETAEELYKELVRKYGNSYVNRPYKVRDNFYAVKLKGYKQFEREQEQSFSKVRREENEVDSPQSGIEPLFQTSDNRTEAIEESKNIESDEGIQSKKQIAMSSGLQGYGTKRTIAIIGTAGRKQVPTLQEWNNMVENAASTVTTKDTLISGGAAFADHIAVRLFLDGKVEGLILRLPAKIVNHKFVGKPAGSTANYYHNNFSKLLGVDTILEIEQAIAKGAKVSYETDTSYKAMFDRNTKIAKESDAMLAYTFGKDNTPSDGGTKDTWDKAKYTNKLHVSIPIQEKQTERQDIQGSKGFIPNPSQSMASPPNVSPAASNSKIGQVKKTNVKAVAKRLAELRIEDSFIKEYSEWLFEATKDVEVEIVNSDYVIASNTDSKGNITEVTLEDRPGAFIPSENKIVINQTKIDNEGSNWLYGTLTHEATYIINCICSK